MPNMQSTLGNLPQNQTVNVETPSPVVVDNTQNTPSVTGNADSADLRGQLSRRFEEIQNAERSLNAKDVTNQINIRNIKTKLIQNLFKIMVDAGVDPSDLGSINNFLQSLEAKDPDLRELFESALNDLLGEGALGESQLNTEQPVQPMGV